MNLREFSAVLTVYAHNFHVLHWGATGRKFDRIHNLADEYYQMITGDIDVVAEQAMRLGQNPGGYLENVKIIEASNSNFLCLDYEEVNFEEFAKYTDAMLDHILLCLRELLASEAAQALENVGIKATLEGLYDKYDLQKRYLNKRRMSDD